MVRSLVLAIAVSFASMCPAAALEEPSPIYAPTLADIMGATQLRHIKLSFAGSVQNWNLAHYEVTQMKDSFDTAAKLYPVFEKVALAKLIADVSNPALAAVDDAIRARDQAAFERNFARLTDACNSCHRGAGFGFIKIRVPTSSPFSNQSFAPAQR